MLARRHFSIALVLPFVAPLVARATTWITRRGRRHLPLDKAHSPSADGETHYEDRQQTVYAEQFQTQFLPSQRTSMVPVREWVSEPYWVNRYNPFAEPYFAYRTVLAIRWETRIDPVQIPVVQRQVVPQQTTVKVPVTTQRFVDEEQTSRVAVAVKPAAAGLRPAPVPRPAGCSLIAIHRAPRPAAPPGSRPIRSEQPDSATF